MTLILGSKSPRRKEILSYYALPFEVISPSFNERSVPPSEDVAGYVKEIALGKARSLAGDYPEQTILTADTSVALKGKIYGKPKNIDEAKEFLRELSGQWHSVFSGVAVIDNGVELVRSEETRVLFAPLTDTMIDHYVSMISPLDKAGGYAIQTSGGLIVKRIEGCYYNVMGLPIQTVDALLTQVGTSLWTVLS